MIPYLKRGSHSCRYISHFPLPGGPRFDKHNHFSNSAYLVIDTISENYSSLPPLRFLPSLPKKLPVPFAFSLKSRTAGRSSNEVLTKSSWFTLREGAMPHKLTDIFCKELHQLCEWVGLFYSKRRSGEMENVRKTALSKNREGIIHNSRCDPRLLP